MCSLNDDTLVNIKQEDDFEAHDEMLDDVYVSRFSIHLSQVLNTNG